MTVRLIANGGMTSQGGETLKPAIVARLLAAAARRGTPKGRLIDRFA